MRGAASSRRALSGIDHWGVLPDGSVWVARVYENRVDWRAPTATGPRGIRSPTGCSR